jgi:hypothetical protein
MITRWIMRKEAVGNRLMPMIKIYSILEREKNVLPLPGIEKFLGRPTNEVSEVPTIHPHCV